MAKVKYGTLDFYRTVMELVNKDEAMKRSKLTTSLLYIYTDRKGSSGAPLSFFVRFDNGKIVQVEETTPNADAEIKASAAYDTWVKIVRDKLNPMTAMMQGIYEMDAPMQKLSSMQGGLARFMEIIRSVDADF